MGKLKMFYKENSAFINPIIGLIVLCLITLQLPTHPEHPEDFIQFGDSSNPTMVDIRYVITALIGFLILVIGSAPFIVGE